MKIRLPGLLLVVLAALALCAPLPSHADSSASVTLSIRGMTCPSCAQKVNAALSHLKGVTKVQLHFEVGEAEVDYRPQETTPEQIAKGLDEATDGNFTAAVKPKS